MTQNDELLQQLSGLSSDAKRSLLTKLMQTQSETERWEEISYNQQALWFHANMAPESTAYNLLYSIRAFERMESSALQKACHLLVQRYPILTGTFMLQDEKLLLHIMPQQAIPIEEIDATEWSSETLQQEIISASNQVIDLAQGPLFRVLLYRRDGAETIMALLAHHIIVDFWAFNILIDELLTLYQAAKTHSIITLPPPLAQHKDYVEWQQKMLASPSGQRHWDYWQETLSAPLPVLHLPTDHARPAVQTYHGSTFDLTLNRTLTDQLRKLASQEKVTPFTLLLTAYQTLIFRLTDQKDILIGTPALGRDEAMLERLIDDITNPVIIRSHLTPDLTFLQLLRKTQQKTLQALEHQDFPFPLLVERLQPERDLSHPPLYLTSFTWDKPRRRAGSTQFAIEPFLYGQQGTLFDLALTIFEFDDELRASFRYNTGLFEATTIERFAHHFLVMLEHIVAEVDQPLQRIPLMTPQEQRQIVIDWNSTDTSLPAVQALHQLIAEQALATPDALALVCSQSALTYHDLNERANQVAHYIRKKGSGPDVAIAVSMERSLELMIVLLGILKAGGAYIPLDPQYPAERITWVLDDAQPAFVVTQKQWAASLARQDCPVICIEDIWSELLLEGIGDSTEDCDAQQTAYIIYTSGSTGRPKGVMISHHNVLNFFAGMDAILQPGETSGQKTWLAVTSISFDISVLELFWTLSRGFKVVVQAESEGTPSGHKAEDAMAVGEKEIEFSLFYFANVAKIEDAAAGYKLLLEGAQYADQHGFSAVWTPERHFHEFGGLYPNPSVVSAALAALTKNIQIRAGSVVLPLHNPVRVAEEWSLVDQLSHGRTGIAFASGWNPNDFAFAPEKYTQRKAIMVRDIETVRALWRGESVMVENGRGEAIAVSTFPRPIQAELPVWITSSGSPDTFQLAGASGANILTHLLGQDLSELKQKIAAYHEAWHEHGHDAQGRRGHVTLMVHTFLGTDRQAVREIVREPFSSYLRSSADLMKSLAASVGLDLNEVDDDDMDALVSHAFDRYVDSSGLMGTVESCLPMVEQIKTLGVDEIACLIDFGVATNEVLASLQHLTTLKEQSNRGLLPTQTSLEELSVAQQLIRSGASYLQCTPSLMNMLLQFPEASEALRHIQHILLGGEALSVTLVNELRKLTPATLYNMYGPTETTIWSSSATLAVDSARIDLGQPIANTQIYILDRELQPAPIGCAGELYISGDGVARGYLKRPELTAERFLPNPWSGVQSVRMYRTGDLARYRDDGSIEYLGRTDHQVKLRGFRIELGEIEAALRAHEEIKEAVVILHDDAVGATLAAYVVPLKTLTATPEQLRAYLGQFLPAYMVPGVIMELATFPLTPNGKIDRQVLPRPDREQRKGSTAFVPPQTELQEQLAEIWYQLLEISQISIYDNFFDRGGHSLLITKLATRIRNTFEVNIPLRDLFEAPTIELMTSLIEQRQLELFEQVDDKSLQQMLSSLEDLSEDELQLLLLEQSE